MGAEQGGNRKTAAGVYKKEETDIFQAYDEEERRKPGERNYTEEHAGWESKRQTKNEMDGQHQNLDRTGYEGATEIGGEQTGMEEWCAERVQPSDRGWMRTEEQVNTIILISIGVICSDCYVYVTGYLLLHFFGTSQKTHVPFSTLIGGRRHMSGNPSNNSLLIGRSKYHEQLTDSKDYVASPMPRRKLPIPDA